MDLPLWAVVSIVFGLIFVFLGAGLWIAFALAAVGLITLVWLAGGMHTTVGALVFNAINSFVLVAVPMYIFLGELILRSGLSERLYRGVGRWTEIVPGGLTHSNIVACSIFAAVSGSSVATAATIGTVALREQVSQGYNRRLVMGSIAAGGTLGILIPPSITMILYGAYQQVPVGRLFIGGVIPGIILAGMFSSLIMVANVTRPGLSPARVPFTWSYFPRAVGAFKDIWHILLLIIIVMGGIYLGVATPTEAAAVATFITFIMLAAYKKLSFRVIQESAFSAIRTTGMVLLILVGARILSTGMSFIKLPARVSDFVLGFDLNTYVIWAIIVLMYLVLGCFVEGISLMLLTLPVMFPLVVQGLGFNPIWFGVMLTILIEAALITPPVGVNLFVIHGISDHKNFADVAIGVLPFFVAMVLSLVLFTAFPDLVLFLPDAMFER